MAACSVVSFLMLVTVEMTPDTAFAAGVAGAKRSRLATSLSDPDGYRIEFESPTDAPEETEFSETP